MENSVLLSCPWSYDLNVHACHLPWTRTLHKDAASRNISPYSWTLAMWFFILSSLWKTLSQWVQVGYKLYIEPSDGRDTEGNEYSNSVWLFCICMFKLVISLKHLSHCGQLNARDSSILVNPFLHHHTCESFSEFRSWIERINLHAGIPQYLHSTCMLCCSSKEIARRWSAFTIRGLIQFGVSSIREAFQTKKWWKLGLGPNRGGVVKKSKKS